MRKTNLYSITTLILVLFIVLFYLSGCNLLIMSMYGFKSSDDVLSKKEIENIAFSYGIKPSEIYFLQRSYIDFFDSIGMIHNHNLRSCDTSQISQQFKNHFQPLQILFFDNTGKLVSFLNNCYSGGFPNFKWNRNHELDYIPAKGNTPLDSLISFGDLLRCINNIEGKYLDKDSCINQNYSIVVFWTTFMGRQSKRLIHIIKNKYSHEKELNINILFVNVDCCAYRF